MAKFEAVIINSSGKTTQAFIEADSQATAERLLKRRGKLVSIRRRRALDILPGMNPSDRYTLLVRMSSMIGAKLGAAEALRLIAASFGGTIRRAALGLLERVEGGMDLPTAMEQDRKNFPSAMVALIKAGVHSGETWRALKDAADFEYRMQGIRKGAGKELFQAIFSFILAGALTIASSEYFGPQVLESDLFKNNPNVDVAWVASAANVMTIVMLVLLAFLVGMLWLATAGKQIMPVLADRIILRVPFYKDLVLSRNNYATLYKLGLLISAGVRIEEALHLTETGAPKGALRNDLRGALAAVRGGRQWATAMTTPHPTDRAALASATNREDISRTLDILAVQYRDLYVQRMATFGPVMQMIAALFMSLAGAVLFGMTILPMLQMSSGISM